GKEEGDTGSVVVQPEDAFGEYDQEEVRTISADKIPEDERYPGAHVEVEGEHGHVETIIGGRARVDFNHPLAGKEIEYEYEILEVVEDPLEKAQGLLNSYVDVELDLEIETDEVEEETEEGTEMAEKRTLYIESVPQLQFNQQWMFSKQQVAQQLIDHLDIDRVIIQEIIEGEAAGPMAGMGGMMGGGGGEELGDIEEAIEEEDVDTEEIVE
ncbi:MAG: peptidylprolyl isomerase, partial [Halobacteriaceae archaeon]